MDSLAARQLVACREAVKVRVPEELLPRPRPSQWYARAIDPTGRAVRAWLCCRLRRAFSHGLATAMPGRGSWGEAAATAGCSQRFVHAFRAYGSDLTLPSPACMTDSGVFICPSPPCFGSREPLPVSGMVSPALMRMGSIKTHGRRLVNMQAGGGYSLLPSRWKSSQPQLDSADR